jgi:ketosteroid isomerase-like protein
MDVEASVDRLLSYEAIRQLAYRYAIAVDARDVETVTSMFVDDVKVGPGAVGRDAMRAFFEEAFSKNDGMTILNVGNHLIDFDEPDRAHGVVYCRAEIESGEEWIVQAIVYRDRYERREGIWYFRGRQHLLFYGADMLQRPIGLAPAEQPELGTGKGSMPEIWPTYREFQARHRSRVGKVARSEK